MSKRFACSLGALLGLQERVGDAPLGICRGQPGLLGNHPGEIRLIVCVQRALAE